MLPYSRRAGSSFFRIQGATGQGASGGVKTTPILPDPVAYPSDPLPYSSSSSGNATADRGTDGDKTDGNGESRGGATTYGANAPRDSKVEEPTIILPIEPKPMQSPSPYVQKKIQESKRNAGAYSDIRDLIVKDVAGTITQAEKILLSTYEVKPC